MDFDAADWPVLPPPNDNADPWVFNRVAIACSRSDAGAFGGPYGDGFLRNDLDYGGFIEDHFAGNQDPYYHNADPYVFLRDGLVGIDWPWGVGHPPDYEYYRLRLEEHVEFGEIVILPAGCTFVFDSSLAVNGALQCDADNSDETISLGPAFDSWGGIQFNSSTSIANSSLPYLSIGNATYGAYLSGVTSSGSDRLTFSHCTFDSCGMGVYANYSRLKLDHCNITNSVGGGTGNYGNGVYLTSCAPGQVLIDGCTITGNGTDGTYSSAGIYMYSSSPEIINTTVEDNHGSGIAVIASNPDLNTYYSSAAHHNNIHSNGGATQSGSDGSEIYLASSSYPDIEYNNIWEMNGSNPVGYMIYKNSSNNSFGLTATNNWWGSTLPTNSYFYWGTKTAITWSPFSMYQISSAEDYNYAMHLWEAGDYSGAATYFERCLEDTGVVGINSAHYLRGCYGEMPDGNFDHLRATLQTAASNQQSDDVAKVDRRFATDCLTAQGFYDDALAEYDQARQDAECLNDSVLAIVDYLSVYELVHGHGTEAAGGDIPGRLAKAMDLLKGDRNGSSATLPTHFEVGSAYPNPFNSTTTINYALPERGMVSAGVFDMSGRLVTRLYDGAQEAGRHSLRWRADAAPAGVYLCRIGTGTTYSTTKLVLVK